MTPAANIAKPSPRDARDLVLFAGITGVDPKRGIVIRGCADLPCSVVELLPTPDILLEVEAIAHIRKEPR